MIKNSYCTGEDGKRAFEEANDTRRGGELDFIKPTPPSMEPDNVFEDGRDVSSGDGLARSPTTKKRTLLEMKEGVSEADMEAYKRSRAMNNDPMAGFAGVKMGLQ